MKICPVCNTQNEDEVEYCKDCGADLTAVEAILEQEESAEEAEPVEAAPAAPSEVAPEEAEDVVEVAEEEAEEIAEIEAGEAEEAIEVTDEAAAEEEESITGPYLVVVSTGDKIPLTKPEMVIGREDPISNIFPDIDTTPFGGLEGGVSRKHAKLIESAGQYSIEDLNSTNYTLVNKEKQEPSTPRQLAAGDEIRLGRVALLYML